MMMSKQEIYDKVVANNRELLEKTSGEMTQERMLALLNVAAMQGFQFGARVHMSMMEAQLALVKAQIKPKVS